MSKRTISILFVRALFLLFALTDQQAAESQCLKGQTPATAFPVCAGDTFYQPAIPDCLPSRFIPSLANATVCAVYDPADYFSSSPYWFKFHCFSAGTLGFTLIFNDQNDNYAWQLVDITGRSPNDAYIHSYLCEAGNWTDIGGGIRATNDQSVIVFGCAMPSVPVYNRKPDLQAGHDYLFLVNHRGPVAQGGYKLVFDGGTAGITDDRQPEITRIDVSCPASFLQLKLSRPVLCSGIALDGSDFFISDAPVQIVSATPAGCNEKFETDSVVLYLDAILQQGDYAISMRNGTDNNSLLDYCGNNVAAGTAFAFKVGNIKAGIGGPEVLCPGEKASFTDQSTGNAVAWRWDFQNGLVSGERNPPSQFYLAPSWGEQDLLVKLVVTDEKNCTDSAYHPLKLAGSCVVAMPAAFTPNSDGLNDYFYPINSWKANNMLFNIYNRAGQLLFSSRSRLDKWDGSFKESAQEPGAYVWTLQYSDESNKTVFRKGTCLLIR